MIHGPVCPCCSTGTARGGAGGPSVLVELLLGVPAVAAAVVGRFVAGQVVLRTPTRWDARWRTWAPEVPEQVARMRGERYPRSTWARRPGWHRQAVRLSVTVLALGAWLAPLWTLAAVAVVGCSAAGWAFWRLRRAGLVDRAATADQHPGDPAWPFLCAPPAAEQFAYYAPRPGVDAPAPGPVIGAPIRVTAERMDAPRGMRR